jgi:pantoate ligase/cytidylate kinase
MRLFKTLAGLRCYLETARWRNLPIGLASPKEIGESRQSPKAVIGFVPTMGALHPGHCSLIRRARQENELVVVSIFVNPLQFAPGEDLHSYPQTLEADQEVCRQLGVDVLFTPDAAALGINGEPLTQVIPPAPVLQVLCANSRPHHFPGVTTIVFKFLNLIQPDRLYLGQKDAQQLAILQRMVKDLNLPVEIVPCPTVREVSGLAYSSRNQYLTPEQRLEAVHLSQALQQAEQLFRRGERWANPLITTVREHLLQHPALDLEYVELVHPVALTPLEEIVETGLLAIAAKLGQTRLIDNVVLRSRSPIIAIDGPAGAGKSTVTRLVAEKLGLIYLDTGAMYRAITWLVLQSGISLGDEPAIAELVSQSHIELISTHAAPIVKINGVDVTQAIRSPLVTSQVSAIAAQKAVRQQLVQYQRHLGAKGGIVAEGRDIATHVFPEAELKIFLTASIYERARRRHQDLQSQGETAVDVATLEREIAQRDERDQSRDIAPFTKAEGAIELNTNHLTIPEVVEEIIKLYKNYQPTDFPSSNPPIYCKLGCD